MTSEAPLVLALHGKGLDERSLDGLAVVLRERGLESALLRGPLMARDGFGWYTEHGIGRPHEDSLEDCVAWILGVADRLAGDRPAALFGFSAGMVAGSAALLARPGRFAAAAFCGGCLPEGAGPTWEDGALAGVPVFYGIDPADPWIPGPMIEATSVWLGGPSGARYQERRYEGAGHELEPMAADVADFLAAALL